ADHDCSDRTGRAADGVHDHIIAKTGIGGSLIGNQPAHRVLHLGAIASIEIGAGDVERAAVAPCNGDELDLRMAGSPFVEIGAYPDQLVERNAVADRKLDIGAEKIRHGLRFAEYFRCELRLEKTGGAV